MGISIGNSTYLNSDVVVCNFTQYLNLARTNFDCYDYIVDASGLVTLAPTQDVRMIFTEYPFPNRTMMTSIV